MEWYEAEVRAIERACADGVNGKRQAVFYGSSSMRLWDTLAEDFDSRVLNLGFGGSTLGRAFVLEVLVMVILLIELVLLSRGKG